MMKFILSLSLILWLTCSTFQIDYNTIPNYTSIDLSKEKKNKNIEIPKVWKNYPYQNFTFKKYKNNKNTIQLFILKAKNPIIALGAFFETINKYSQFIYIKNSRLSYLSKDYTTASLWHNNQAIIFESSTKLNRKEWKSIIEPIITQYSKAIPRPLEFSLFLREETRLKEVKLALLNKVPLSNNAFGFFYTKWNHKKKNIYFGFKNFENKIKAEKEFYTLTQQKINTKIKNSKYIIPSIFTKWISPSLKTDYKVIIRNATIINNLPQNIREKIQSEYYFLYNHTIFIFTGSLTEQEVKIEIEKIWKTWND